MTELERVTRYRKAVGDHRFVLDSLDGRVGRHAKAAAETAVTSAVDQGHADNDQRVADEIVALVSADTEEVAAR